MEKLSTYENVEDVMKNFILTDWFDSLTQLMGVKLASKQLRKSRDRRLPDQVICDPCTLMYCVYTPTTGECEMWLAMHAFTPWSHSRPYL